MFEKHSMFNVLRKAYFTTLDNQLWLHFRKKSKETKHILLKPIYVGLRICQKKFEIMLEKFQKCISYQKNCCG